MPVNLLEFVSDNLLHSTSTEDSSSIMQLPVSESIQRSLNPYLESNFLSGENEFFCNICSSSNQALADHEISKAGDHLIIQVKPVLTKTRNNLKPS